MKALGAALILCGTAIVCRTLLGARRRERAALRELADALEGLEREVRVALVPLPRLLTRRGQGRYGDLFFSSILAMHEAEPDCPLPDCWRAAAQDLPLPSRERESVARPADAFGGEEEDLLRALCAAAQELRAALDAREIESARERRLIPALCFSLSLLLTVLLL